MTLHTGLQLIFLLGIGVMVVVLALALQTRRMGQIRMTTCQTALVALAGGLALLAGGLALLI